MKLFTFQLGTSIHDNHFDLDTGQHLQFLQCLCGIQVMMNFILLWCEPDVEAVQWALATSCNSALQIAHCCAVFLDHQHKYLKSKN